MSVLGRLVGFALALVLVFGGGWAVGNAVGPVGEDDPVSAPGAHTPRTTADTGARTTQIRAHDEAHTPAAGTEQEAGQP